MSKGTTPTVLELKTSIMHIPTLHQDVILGYRKEREMGVLQTSLLSVQISIQGGPQQHQVHSCSNISLQQSHVIT